MNEEVINKLQEIFTPVAEKIGQGAQFGWEVVLRQQYVVAVLGVVQFVGGILLAIALYFIFKYSIKGLEKEDNNDVFYIIGIVLAMFGSITSVALILSGVYDAVTHFINPAYYALEFFINLAK